MNKITLFLLLSVTTCLGFPSVKKHGTSIAPRIINGQTAKLGQFPWQAAISVNGILSRWFCGGSIISDRWILTAGHCVELALTAKIITGSLNPNNGTVSIVSNEDDFFLHEDFDLDTIANDIGLIKLSEPLKFDENTQPIQFAEEELDANVKVIVSGWGIVHDGDTTISNELNFVNLVTITNEVCNKTFGMIRDEMVCAGSDSDSKKSTCSGDSGGALVSNDEKPIQVGIVSFVSDDGCETGAPSGYTRVATYKDWIRSKMSDQ